METNIIENTLLNEKDEDVQVDPIDDIIDYLVRCAKISFKNPHVDEAEVTTSEKICAARELYNRSPTEFLMQFGKYLTSSHVEYFEKSNNNLCTSFRTCVEQLKEYHSDASRRKRIRNRRYNALQKFANETDYFSEKQMMYRNPLLYEQLVGQYLTNEEIKHRDGVGNVNISLLNLVLETVDHNFMREKKNKQMIEEGSLQATINTSESENNTNEHTPDRKKMWGDFDTPDVKPGFGPDERKQIIISTSEQNLLREEFLQEMYNSFMEGYDLDIDYVSIDNDEQYDDLQQMSQDAEDKYFDSETNEVDSLEEHMKLVEEFARINSNHDR
ncbi:coiled-coil domain-containing protein 97 [Manduca sexta]|uniref:coiled-coil domain-containing protein 97 n=1 Tax=Manduca sexta TaxID=7130 RepID=UPI0011845A29|nr:coiled-coil domain-containing protein 97 [Manduca sexta]